MSTLTLTTKEQIHFAKRMSFLLKAGISLSESIQVFTSKNYKKHYLFNLIYNDISQGAFLYQAMKKYSTFGPLALNLIRSGEESGTLAENFSRLAIELQKRQRFHQKITSAFIYPTFIALATILLSSFLLFYIFPKIRPLFISMKIQLPWSTRLIMSITSHNAFYILAFFIFLFIFSYISFMIVHKKPYLRFLFHSFLLRLPLLGKLIKTYEVVTYFYAVSTLLQGGAHIQYACVIGAEVCKNSLYKKATAEITTLIEQGKTLSNGLHTFPLLFPQELADMIETAESAGTLPETLLYISEMNEQELEEKTKNLSNAIEPLLMISMGLIVGFIALSIITPIYSLTQHIKH
jgi:type II secretory pathway component PulF